VTSGDDDPYAGRAPTRHERLFGPWDASYADGPAPWDLGRPQPAIVRLAECGGVAGSVLDAGCGTGEHALYLASRGHEIVGVDVAPTAIDRACRAAADRGLAATFLVADALRLASLGRTFDAILDVGLFHTFDDDDERRAYVASLASVTRPGSVLHLLCFSDAAPGEGGPRRIGRAELRSGFATGWDVVSISAETIETRFDPGGVPAWLARIART
jgi:SAM-dependent methyltransferase